MQGIGAIIGALAQVPAASFQPFNHK